MGMVALLSLLANIAVAWMLYAFCEGDAHMRSVLLCSRNDAVGNVAVFIAAPDKNWRSETLGSTLPEYSRVRS